MSVTTVLHNWTVIREYIDKLCKTLVTEILQSCVTNHCQFEIQHFCSMIFLQDKFIVWHLQFNVLQDIVNIFIPCVNPQFRLIFVKKSFSKKKLVTTVLRWALGAFLVIVISLALSTRCLDIHKVHLLQLMLYLIGVHYVTTEAIKCL